MKKIAILLMITAFLVSCNPQTKNTKSKGLKPPYNEFKEGEVALNFEALTTDKKEELKTSMDSFDYKYPSETDFNTIVKQIFNLDISVYNHNIIVLQHSLMPEIAIKDLKLVYVEYDSDISINGEFLFNYNNYLFYNSKTSFDWLRNRQPSILKELVISYGYIKDEDLLDFVFSTTDFTSKPELDDLLFKTEDLKYSLRKEILYKIREIVYNNQEVTGFSETIDGDFYYTLLPIINHIQSNKELYNHPEESIAVLLNEMAKSGITGGIDSFINNDSSIIQILEKNDYFGQSNLKEYITVVYEKEEIINYGQIIDPDGHTNLRKKPSSDSDILQRIATGEMVEIVSKDSLWYKVNTDAGQTGYVHNSRLKMN